MDDLLEQCKSCEKSQQYFTPELCEGCNIYKQLREIGDSLGKIDTAKPKPLKITIEEFVQHRYIGKLKYKEIASLYGLNYFQINGFYQRHKKKINKYLEEKGIN